MVSEPLALAVVAAVTVVVVRFTLAYMHFRRLELAISGPPSLPLLGNALHFLGATPDTVIQKLRSLVGGPRKMTRITFLNRMMVVVSDPTEIEEVVSRKEFDDKAELPYRFLTAAIKKNLVALGGAEWRVHRKWLSPAFSKSLLDQFTEVFSEEAHGFVDRLKSNKELSLLDNLRKTSVRNILRTGYNCDRSAASMFDSRMVDLLFFIDFFFETFQTRSINFFLWWDKIFLRTARGKVTRTSLLAFDNLIGDMFRRTKSQSSPKGRTLADLMCEEMKIGTRIPKTDVLDEAKTFVVGAVDSTVTAKSWMLKALSILPDVQDRIHAELVEVLGDSDRPVATGDLPQLKYLDRVVKECLRMFPPFPLVSRHCHAETTLCGRTIPAGCSITIDIAAAHRHPEYWDHPERFDPDRFLPENSKDRHPCAFIPFSRGRRECIATRYAMNSLRVFLATTIRAYKVLPVDDHRDLQSLYDNMTLHFSSKLVGGVRVMFKARVLQEK